MFSRLNILQENLNTRIAIKFLITILVFVLSHAVAADSNAERSVGVLVAAESSPLHKMSVLEIRRLYLGLSSSENLIINTVINLSDPIAYKDFLKNVMHMTDTGYRRKIVKRIFRQGGRKVNEMQDVSEIVNYLTQDLYAVSFMTDKAAKDTKGIKVVQVLW